MKNYVQDGKHLDLTVPSGGVTSGQPILFTTKLGIAVKAASAGETAAFAMRGVFTIAKKSADTFAEGAACYWDDSNKEITSTASGNTLVGYAAETKAGSTTSMKVKLEG